MRSRVPTSAVLLAAISLVFALAGCGSSSSSSSTTTSSSAASPSTSTTTPTASTAPIPPAVNELPAAENPHMSQFPAAHGRTLVQLGGLVKSSANLGAATGTFTPGTRRYAFALTSRTGGYI